jgi:hypothetical protein
MATRNITHIPPSRFILASSWAAVQNQRLGTVVVLGEVAVDRGLRLDDGRRRQWLGDGGLNATPETPVAQDESHPRVPAAEARVTGSMSVGCYTTLPDRGEQT